MSSESDFNDLSVAYGSDEVKRCVDRALKAARSVSRGKEAVRQEQPDIDWQVGLDRDQKSGRIRGTTGNVYKILRDDEQWRGVLAYCDFSYEVIKRGAPIDGMQAGPWTDADTSLLITWLNTKWGIDPSEGRVLHAVVSVAKQNAYHPVRDYLRSLSWDREPRLERWLIEAFGAISKAGHDRYIELVGRLFMVGAVARVMQPGCKMDNVLILEGSQGRGKSTALNVLFGDWFSDAPLPLGEKDAYQYIQGVWGQELAELDSFNKAESTTAKSFFSQIKDRFRPSYGRHVQSFLRQTVFTGTTNQDEYLRDYTGNRRYWPVYCQRVDVDYVRESRDQLWAEAVAIYDAGESWWVTTGSDDDQMFRQEQDTRMVLDPWHYMVEDYLRSVPDDFVTGAQVLVEAVKKPEGSITRADQNRLGPIMKAIGWSRDRGYVLVGASNVRKNGYRRPEGWDCE